MRPRPEQYSGWMETVDRSKRQEELRRPAAGPEQHTQVPAQLQTTGGDSQAGAYHGAGPAKTHRYGAGDAGALGRVPCGL